jgi:hypothetical protein
VLRRLDAVERELREIKHHLGSLPDPDKQRDSNSRAPEASSVESDNSPLTGVVSQGPDLNERLTSKAIGDVELNPSSIFILLEEYDLSILPK